MAISDTRQIRNRVMCNLTIEESSYSVTRLYKNQVMPFSVQNFGQIQMQSKRNPSVQGDILHNSISV